MPTALPKTFQMRFDLENTQDRKIAFFLQSYPWSKSQKVKEILLEYIEHHSQADNLQINKNIEGRVAVQQLDQE